MKFSTASIAALSFALSAVASPMPEGATKSTPQLEARLLSSVLSTVTSTTSSVVGVATKVIGTVGSAVGSVSALLQGNCGSSQFQKCTITVTGEIENMLGDGANFTGLATVSGWMQNGHAYGSAKLAGVAPLPFNITCNANANVCTGTAAGNVTQVFANGKQISLWGWTTPEGYCNSGVCYGSITTLGDPGY